MFESEGVLTFVVQIGLGPAKGRPNWGALENTSYWFLANPGPS